MYVHGTSGRAQFKRQHTCSHTVYGSRHLLLVRPLPGWCPDGSTIMQLVRQDPRFKKKVRQAQLSNMFRQQREKSTDNRIDGLPFYLHPC